MCDLQSREGVTSARNADPLLIPGMLLPRSFAEEPEEAGGAWSAVDGIPELLEDFEGLEHAFTAETADAEALEPHTLTEAKCRLDWARWVKVIEEELATLNAAGTWRLEEALPDTNVIRSKWVFKAKKDTAGNVACYKARLVTQGFSQIGGVDYNDTYVPVAKLASSCAIITMVNHLGLELHQVDIKGAYLNGVLNEDKVLYVQHPPGYKAPGAGMCVLCLVKTLYSLKQSGQCWYQGLTSIFTSLGFKHCSVNEAVFFKWDQHKHKLTIVAVHIDDCTIAVINYLYPYIFSCLSHYGNLTLHKHFCLLLSSSTRFYRVLVTSVVFYHVPYTSTRIALNILVVSDPLVYILSHLHRMSLKLILFVNTGL